MGPSQQGLAGRSPAANPRLAHLFMGLTGGRPSLGV